MRRTSLDSRRWSRSIAWRPRVSISPMWETSKTPTPVRTASCSSRMPAYWTGISQPANGTSLAPAAWCRSNRGVRRSVSDCAATRARLAGATHALARARVALLGRLGVVPVAGPGRDAGGLLRAPRAGVIRDRRHLVAEDRVDHPPRRLDHVLAGEQAGVALHGVAQQALVGRHVVGGGLGDAQLDVLADHPGALLLGPGAHADGDVGLQAEADGVEVPALARED